MMREHLGGELDECINVDFHGAPRLRSERRDVLESSHASVSRVTESLDCTEASGAAALRRKPRVDERVAESVWQGVSQQAGKTVERSTWQIGKLVDLSTERHHDRRELNAARDELGSELERCGVACVFHRDRSDRPPPQTD